MNSIETLLSMAAPDPMGRRHDDDPADRKLHLAVAVDRVVLGMTVDECRARHRISKNSVPKFVAYAVQYRDDPAAELVRLAIEARENRSPQNSEKRRRFIPRYENRSA